METLYEKGIRLREYLHRRKIVSSIKREERRKLNGAADTAPLRKPRRARPDAVLQLRQHSWL